MPLGLLARRTMLKVREWRPHLFATFFSGQLQLTPIFPLLGEWILNQTVLSHSTQVFTWQSAAFNPAPRPVGAKEPVLYGGLRSRICSSIADFTPFDSRFLFLTRSCLSSHYSPAKPFAHTPAWLTSKLDSLNGPFRLFGEVVPTLLGQNPKAGISSILSILNRHYKLLMMALASDLELSLLASQFDIELQSLAAYFGYCASQSDASQSETIVSTMLAESKALIERTDPNSTDETTLLQVCFGLRSCFLEMVASLALRHSASEPLQLALRAISTEVLVLASKSATILCAMAIDPKPSPMFFRLLLRTLQHLFQLCVKMDNEGSQGRFGWSLLASETIRSLPTEVRWSLVLLVSSLNTSALTSPNAPQYYASWDSVQEILSSDILKAPKDGRLSPTKDPTGPSRGIYDLLLRFKYFCGIWSVPPMDMQSLMARFFSERMSRTSLRSLQLLDTDEQLAVSQSVFDQYLLVVRKDILSSPQMSPIKLRMTVAKMIETFLNVLEDLDASNLDPELDVPPLLRNCLQLSLAVVDFLSDQEVQSFLLERLLAISLQPLSPLSLKITTQGLFRLLAKLSSRETPQSVMADFQTQDDFEFHEVDFKPSSANGNQPKPYIRNVDSELKKYDQSRKRLVEHFSTTLLEYIISYYLKMASSHQSHAFTSNSNVQQSTTSNLSLGQSKRPKTLDISNAAAPFLNAEKLITTYMKHSKLIFEQSYSSAAIALLSPARFADLLGGSSVSAFIRQLLNEMVQALIIASRNTTTEDDLKSRWESLWQSAAKFVSSANMPSKLLTQLAELQGLLLYALRGDKRHDLLEFGATGVYKRDAAGRSIPLYAAQAWLNLVSSLLKLNIYTPTPLAAESGIWIGSVLISASLEQSPQPPIAEICARLHDVSRLSPTSIPASLHAVSKIVSEELIGATISSLPPGHIAKLVIAGFLAFRQRQPDHARDLTPYFTKLIKHIDDVIERNRSELEANGTKHGRYDDSIYEFVSFTFKAIPHWLHSKSDARYNVFGRLLADLFLDPLKSMAPVSVAVNEVDQSFRSSAPQSATSALLGGANKPSSGMVFGKSPKTAPTSSKSANQQTRSTPMKLVAPSSINDNAIRFLPFAIHAIAQLPFETDGDVQRYMTELVVSIFRSFVTGKDGSHDARLIEQLAAGLVETSTVTVASLSSIFSTSSSTSSTTSSSSTIFKDDPSGAFSTSASSSDAAAQQLAVIASRIRSLRIFFCANLVPWIKTIIEQRSASASLTSSSEDAKDTNCFVLARILSWLFLKLRHSKEQPALELIKSFLMTSNYVLDLYRSLKPTIAALSKKEMMNYFVIFCSTLLKLVPHSSPVSWIQSTDPVLYEQLLANLREWLSAVERDLDYISTSNWPPTTSEADSRSDLRHDHINTLFTRTKDTSLSLSMLALVDNRGSIDSLKELAKVLCEAIDFVRQLDAVQLVKQIQERIRSILYLPDEGGVAQRHSRGDIKAALEVARKDFGKINWLLNSVK